MDNQPRYVRIDWTSRMLAVASLLIAVGSVAYVTVYRQDDANSDEILQTVSSGLDGKLQAQANSIGQSLEATLNKQLEQYDERITTRSQQLSKGLANFEQSSEETLKKMAQQELLARQDRETRFTSELESMRTVAARPIDDAGSTQSAAPSAAAAQLVLTQTGFKPEGDLATLLRIANQGQEDAQITRIRFKPESHFERTPQRADTDSPPGSTLTVYFDASDNQTTKPGHHGLYDRVLTQPIVIRAGQSQWLRLAIDSPRASRWGFTGQLRLDYNDSESLMMKAARVVIQPAPAAEST